MRFPHSTDLEERLLGAVMLSTSEARMALARKIKSPLFADPFCRLLWDAVAPVVSAPHDSREMLQAIYRADCRPPLQSTLGAELALLMWHRDGTARTSERDATYLLIRLQNLAESRLRVIDAHNAFLDVYREAIASEIP